MTFCSFLFQSSVFGLCTHTGESHSTRSCLVTCYWGKIEPSGQYSTSMEYGNLQGQRLSELESIKFAELCSN